MTEILALAKKLILFIFKKRGNNNGKPRRNNGADATARK